MNVLKSVNHIGYAVFDIQATAEFYVNNGWTLSEVFDEKVQHARIAFLTKEGFPKIELVSPLEGKSPVDKFLKSSGCCPYHICYNVDSIDEAMEKLYNNGFVPLFAPVESSAMDNHKICYMINFKVGLIEIVEMKYKYNEQK